MKIVSFIILAALFCTAPMLYMQEETQPPQQLVTVQDYDTEIAHLKKDINRYKGLASMYNQQAQLVEFRDFDGYRDSSNLRDRCLAVVKELNEHLTILEKQRAMLASPEKAPEKKS